MFELFSYSMHLVPLKFQFFNEEILPESVFSHDGKRL